MTLVLLRILSARRNTIAAMRGGLGLDGSLALDINSFVGDSPLKRSTPMQNDLAQGDWRSKKG